MAGEYRFSFGPWNIHEGADPFGPVVRDSIEFGKKLKMYKKLGFDGVQFHDDDAVPDMDRLSAEEIVNKAKGVGRMLESEGLAAEERSRRMIDIADALGTKLIVLWLAREGTYVREAKDSRAAVDQIVEAINDMLGYNSEIKIAIEPKPNEPMDQAYIPTTGHAVAVAYLTNEPERVGVNIETAHVILAGLDPSDEMGFALAYDKLFTVHLNDQNGLKFDEDRTFGAINLRRAFNQVRILDQYDYGKRGEFVGLDVKAMRTQKQQVATKHLANSRTIFLQLVELARSLDRSKVEELIKRRDYEGLDMLVTNHLMGK